ncbi:MAG TPA: hypothetical protein DIC59_13475 [Candidatus Competibacteraceae bacterium]|nr:hypothetical protein [Candidatus Competibacteraceae bacterium]
MVGVMVGVMAGVIYGAMFVVVFGVAGTTAGGVMNDVMNDVMASVIGVLIGVLIGVAFGVTFGVTFGVIILRLDAILLAFISILLQPSKRRTITLQRVSPIPIWNLRRQLAQQLKEDWQKGLDNCEGLLRYSLQFAPVITAIRETLQNTTDDRLLSSVANWCSMPLYDWNVVYFQSAGLKATIKKSFLDGPVSHRSPPRSEAATLRYNTPVKAACAGFWLLHQGELAEAADGFAVVRHLPHGEELYANGRVLAAASQCQTLEQIAAWQMPPSPQDKLLRPQVRAAFARLAEVAKDIAVVLHARSTRQRSSALNRASGKLHFFSAESVDCPTPERPQLEKIASRWLEIILASASAVGSLDVRETVASPYIVGAPVPAARLIGRYDILAQIEAAWAKPGQRDSLVIFGHRRMGKTSIARNVAHLCQLGDDTRLAFLNLQAVDWTEGLRDLCHAIAFALWEADPNGLAEPAPEDYEQHPLAALRRLLARLEQAAPPRRYILILDEYELLEEKLPDAVAGDRTALLRGLTQQHTWLALGLVGLHSLKERSASLREAIFGWRPIPVGLMDRDALADLLQIEDDAFPLEYDLEAIDRAHALTGGQPFLGQLLGDSLVQRFNQQLKQRLEPPAPTFTTADVDAVVEDSRFYVNGHVYFNGIWAQAGEAPPGQQTLLKLLAPHGDGLDPAILCEQSGLDPAAFTDALDALARHDVVNCHNGRCRYSVEMMRRWVADYSTLSHSII